MKLLFWNINGQNLSEQIDSLVREHQFDFIILAEDRCNPAKRLLELNARRSDYHYSNTLCERIQFYSRYSSRFVRPKNESKYYSFREINLPFHEPLLIASVHWKGLTWRSEASQNSSLVELARTIREEENRRHINHTIVVGDLNSDPFSSGMQAINGMHAVMSRTIARKGERTMSPFGKLPFFYNPTWSKFGDESYGPPGTYYRSSSEEICQYWHAFDQILIRPSLIDGLPKKSLEVITSTGKFNLIGEGGAPHFSDHLPLSFTFNLPTTLSER